MKMKKILSIVLAVVMALSLSACTGGNKPDENSSDTGSSQNVADNSQDNSQTQDNSAASSGSEKEQPAETPDSKTDASQAEPVSGSEGSGILVVYFSATNNTESVAQKLADGLGADIYEIVPMQPYTDEDLDYGNSESRSSVEMDDPSVRPEISGTVENMDQYEVVLIGFPIWWGKAPRIMSTFVESYDFSGKTLAAFCTSASSGFGSSDSALKEATDSAIWLDGHRFSAGASAEDVMEWADGLGIN